MTALTETRIREIAREEILAVMAGHATRLDIEISGAVGTPELARVLGRAIADATPRGSRL